jgi:hypothetical protein
MVQDVHGVHAYYLDMMTAKKIYQGNLDDSIHQILLLPEGTRIPTKPVLFSPDFIGGSKTLNMVLFDYAKNVVLVFGYYAPLENDIYASWDEWEGKKFWKAIADRLGWEVEPKPKIIRPNWTRVSLLPS